MVDRNMIQFASLIPLGHFVAAVIAGLETSKLGLYFGREMSSLTAQTPCAVVPLGPMEDEESHPIVARLGVRFVIGRSELPMVIDGLRQTLSREPSSAEIIHALEHYIQHDSFLIVGGAEPTTVPDLILPPETVSRVWDLVADLAAGRFEEIEDGGRSPWLSATEIREVLIDRPVREFPGRHNSLHVTRSDDPDVWIAQVVLSMLADGRPDLMLDVHVLTEEGRVVIGDLYVR